MGKKNQGQRTKGNARPSSSARAAEILTGSGKSVQGFVGFGTPGAAGSNDSTASGAFGTQLSEDNSEIQLDSDLRLALKKLSKKDPTTKLKALQELGQLCREKEASAVCAVLPQWSRLYNKLAIDEDRRVREATQVTFTEIIGPVGKELAGQLKSVMGVWVLAQCDVFAPAASAARSAFQSAFPPAKQADALFFCREEILQCAMDNVFPDITATAASSAEDADMAELPENKRQRYVTLSLGALSLVVTSLSKQQVETIAPRVEELLQDGRFWKLAKDKADSIRAAFFSLLASVCQAMPATASLQADKLCPAVLYSLDENSPSVCRPVWESALSVLTAVPDCWSRINARKGLLPKLWTLLRVGCKGSATVVGPNLLPLLSQVPASVVGDGLEFYHEWFNNMLVGLRDESVVKSRSEFSAFITAYMECLQYAINQVLGKGEQGSDMAQTLVTSHLLPLVEEGVTQVTLPLSNSPLFVLVTRQLLSLCRLFNVGDESRSAGAKQVFSILFDSLSLLCARTVDAPLSATQLVALERVGLLVESLRKMPKSTGAGNKEARVKFAAVDNDDKADKVSSAATDATSSSSATTAEAKYVAEKGHELATQLSGKCLRLFDTAKSIPYLTLLTKLLRVYGNKQLILHLVSSVETATGVDESSAVCENVPEDAVISQLVEVTVIPWLAHFTSLPGNHSKELAALADIATVLFDNVVSSRDVIVTRLFQVSDDVSFLLPILKHVVHSSSALAAAGQALLAFDGVAQLASRTLAAVLSADSGASSAAEEQEEAHQLLLFLVAKSPDGLYILDQKVMRDLLAQLREEFARRLADSCSGANDEREGFAVTTALLPSLTDHLLRACQDRGLDDEILQLTLILWRLSCMSNDDGNAALLNVVRKDSWNYVLRKFDFDALFNELCTQVTDYLVDSGSTVSQVELVVQQLVEMVEAAVLVRGTWSRQSIMMSVIDSITTAITQPPLMQLCAESLAISQVLTFVNMPEHHVTEADMLAAARFVRLCLFNAHLAVASLSRDTQLNSVAVDSDEGSVVDDNSTSALYHHRMLERCILALVFLDNQTCMKSKQTDEVRERLHAYVTRVLLPMTGRQWTDLLRSFSLESRSSGGLWALGLSYLLTVMSHASHKAADVETEIFSVVESWCQDEATLHTVVQLLPHLSPGKLSAVAEVLGAQLLSCVDDIDEHLPDVTIYLSALGHVLRVSGAETSSGEGTQMADAAVSVLDQLVLWKRDGCTFLMPASTKSSDDSSSWTTLVFTGCQLRFAAACVQRLPTRLSRDHWDYVLCAAVTWTQFCSDQQPALLTSLAVQTVAISACRLVTALADVMTNTVTNNPAAFHDGLLTEWNELFSAAIFGALLPLFVRLAEGQRVSNTVLTASQTACLQSLGSALSCCPSELVCQSSLPPRLTAGERRGIPESVQTLFNHLCPLLTSQCRCVQLTAFTLLSKVIPSLVKTEEEQHSAEGGDQDGADSERAPLLSLVSVLERSAAVVDDVLADADPECAVLIEPEHLTEFSGTFAYLLTWKFLLLLISSSSAQLRLEYTQYLRHRDFIDTLLKSLFHLMPENPTVDRKTSQSSASFKDTQNMFTIIPDLAMTGDYLSSELQHVACRVYYEMLCELPAVTRHWWNGLSKKSATIVNEFTTRFVSPILCANELHRIQAPAVAVENLAVKARPATREVLATYSTDELSMELVITLAVNHPLGAVGVTTEKRLGVTSEQWNKWMLQMTTLLMHQNGSILDGILMWKRNVDKRFEGVEECTICFHVIHSTNNQLPKLQCRTCKKKYHSACLYKWFNTSNKSTCPLCRNLF